MNIVHPKCGKSWTGLKAEHCSVCCETFTGTVAGDKHRVGSFDEGTRRCLTAPEMIAKGLKQNDKEHWSQDDNRIRKFPSKGVINVSV